MGEIINKHQWYNTYGISCLFNGGEIIPVSKVNLLCNYEKDIIIRHKKNPNRLRYIVKYSELSEILKLLQKEYKVSSLRELDTYILLGKVMDDSKIIVQGNYDGLNVEVSFEKCAMPKTKLDKRISKFQLKMLVGDELYTVMNDILEIYPNHIIEFSKYNSCLGVYKKDYIIWEIRKY